MTSPFSSMEEVRRHQEKVKAWRSMPKLVPADKPAKVDKTRPEYVPVKKRRRGMNGLETAFSQNLEAKKDKGEIMWWAFEPVRLRLADDTYFKPDFLVMDRDGRMEVYETKGYMREAARVRLNVAADKFPWSFYLVRKTRGGFAVNPV